MNVCCSRCEALVRGKALLPEATLHTICPACLRRLLAELRGGQAEGDGAAAPEPPRTVCDGSA